MAIAIVIENIIFCVLLNVIQAKCICCLKVTDSEWPLWGGQENTMLIRNYQLFNKYERKYIWAIFHGKVNSLTEPVWCRTSPSGFNTHRFIRFPIQETDLHRRSHITWQWHHNSNEHTNSSDIDNNLYFTAIISLRFIEITTHLMLCILWLAPGSTTH